MKHRMIGVLMLAAPVATHAVPLGMVEVEAPAINCVFHPSCTVTVIDTSEPLTLAASSGSGFLQSRTFTGSAGAPATGRYGYEYRIDLRAVAGVTAQPCIRSLTLRTGPLAHDLDYNGDGVIGEQIYVVTGGGLGTLAPASAEQVGSSLTFTFATPVCTGSYPGGGDSSFFFGFASPNPPRFVEAQLHDTLDFNYNLEARAPVRLALVAIDDILDLLQILPLEAIPGPSAESRRGRRAAMLESMGEIRAMVERGDGGSASRALAKLMEDDASWLRAWVQDAPHTRRPEDKELVRVVAAAREALNDGEPKQSQAAP